MRGVRDPGKSGFTLVEVMVCLGAVGVFAFLTAYYLDFSNGRLKMSRGMNSRDKITSSIEAYTSLVTALRISANQPVNSSLMNCLTVPISFLPNQPATNCNGTQWSSFFLYSPMVQSGTLNPDGTINSAGMVISGYVTGGPTSPGRFNLRGEPCNPTLPASVDCPIEVVTEWRPQCPPAAGTAAPASFCAVPELLLVRYTIRWSAAIPPSAVPEMGTFPTLAGVVATRWTDLRYPPSPSVNQPYQSPTPAPSSSSGSSGGSSSGFTSTSSSGFTSTSGFTSSSTSTSTSSSSSASSGGASGGSGSSSSSSDGGWEYTSSSGFTSTSSSGFASTSSGHASTSSSGGPPQLPVRCPGDTVQIGPITCSCPNGMELVDDLGTCANVSL